MSNLTSTAAAVATPCTCPVHYPSEAPEIRPRLPGETTRAIITINPHEGFRPHTPKSQPVGILGHQYGKELIHEFALAYNESAHSIRKGKWAVVTTGGDLLLLPIDPEHRPPSPDKFHPAAREFVNSSNDEVQELAGAENTIRFEQAILPREWSVPLACLTPVYLKREERRKSAELQPA